MIHTGDAVPTAEQAILEATPLQLELDLYEASMAGNRPTHQDLSINIEQKGITVAKVGPLLHYIVLAIAILSHSSSQGNRHKISLVHFSINRPQLRPGTPQTS
jgi:hypothetical protein